MKKYLLLLACLPTLLNSQVYDDFADGNLTNDPIWNGTTGIFKVNNNYQLQLADSAENISYLSTSSVFSDETEWQIWVRLAFSPSSNNLARIYLLSDKTDLTQPLNGYFLQLGESGSSDALELFRQDGLDNFSVCRGTEGFISSSFSIRIKVTRDETGFWQILTDPNGGEAFQLQAEGMDDYLPETGYVGLYCEYTKSNASKMYFDDIYSGPWIVDQLPPSVLELVATSDSTLQLYFNEPLDRTEAEYPDNYTVSQGIGSPVMATISEDLTKISLLFSEHFVSGQNYLLGMSGIKDLAGNLMEPVELAFNFYNTQAFDIVINEIMSDPSPPAGLPDYEYLELFNRTGYILNLDKWVLQIGESDKEIKGVSIQPDGYLILGRDEAKPHLEQYGPFYGFSSFSLTNAGQELILKDANGIEISRVNYNENWHSDPSKMEGGWSLEQINPDDVCASELNWRTSENSLGGTPGSANSVDSNQAKPPALSYLEVMDDHNLMVLFTQSMNMESLSQRSHYFVENGIGNPSSITTFDDQNYKVGLYFEKPLEDGILYRLTINKNLQNCIGNSLEYDTTIYFGLAAMAEENDILINEILFNPWLNGSDYVEIYNKSEKVIDLSSLKLGTVKVSPPNPNDTILYSISQRQLLMLPASYLVLTREPEAVKAQYFPSYPDAFVTVNPFPAYGNDNGSCLLVFPSDILVDAFDYLEEMHYPLLNYFKGVSLERTGFTGNSKDATNWHSASENAGFGTPGYRNSQMASTTSAEDEIVINPEIFSPDNDGYNDIASIDYHFGQAGYMMTVKIYNSGGNLVRNLVNNKYLGTEGSVYWDGIQDDNTKSPIGIYVFYIQVWDLNGQVKKYKKTAVVAAKLQ